MKLKWVKQVDKETVERISEKLDDTVKVQLMQFVEKPDLDAYDKKLIDVYKKRQMIKVHSHKTYKISKGENYSEVRQRLETILTTEMLRTGEWKEKNFKKYNFNAVG